MLDVNLRIISTRVRKKNWNAHAVNRFHIPKKKLSMCFIVKLAYHQSQMEGFVIRWSGELKNYFIAINLKRKYFILEFLSFSRSQILCRIIITMVWMTSFKAVHVSDVLCNMRMQYYPLFSDPLFQAFLSFMTLT